MDELQDQILTTKDKYKQRIVDIETHHLTL